MQATCQLEWKHGRMALLTLGMVPLWKLLCKRTRPQNKKKNSTHFPYFESLPNKVRKSSWRMMKSSF